MLTQVPPNILRSAIATFIPAPASRNAKDGPAWPVPITIASNSGMCGTAGQAAALSQAGANRSGAAAGRGKIGAAGVAKAASCCNTGNARSAKRRMFFSAS